LFFFFVSTLSRILLSYAARVGHKPIFCDLDVGQNSISIPGVVAATSVEQPIAVESSANDAFALKAPLCYFYGHSSPSISKELYMRSVERLAETVEKRCMEYRHVSNSGIILNTCGWIDQNGLGMELLLHAVEKFRINIILVLEKDDLYNMIKQESKIKEKSVYVAQLSKSGGVR
jgi:polyribonucleotide 5'-hydroxyl-kinase